MTHQSVPLLALLAALPLASCKNANASPPPPAAHAVDTVKLPAAPPDASDADAAALVRATIDASLARAKAASTRASNANVRALAATVKTDSERVDADARAAFGATIATPSADARAVAASEKTSEETLEKKLGNAFDAAFLDAEIAADDRVIAAIDRLKTTAPKTKAVVDALRKETVAHRDRAKELHTSVPSR